jgi:hypothetical protein
MAKGKRKLRKGSKDVAIAYTKAKAQRRHDKQIELEEAGKGGFNKRKPNYSRRAELEALQIVEQNRWPDDDQLVMYHELNTAKKPGGNRSRKPIKPRVEIFPLMDEISDVTRNRMLIAASLKMQPVKRSPGWILSRTYNHKKRVITFV